MLDLPVTLTDRILKPARLCTITRLDGEIIRIAEAQEPITVIDAAATWFPLAGFQMSAGKWQVGGEAASIQIDAAMSVGGTFDLYEVVDGKFDAAAVRVDLVDRANPATKGLIFSGRIEPVSFGALHHNVSFDVRGHAVKARWPFSWTSGRCAALNWVPSSAEFRCVRRMVARGTAYTHPWLLLMAIPFPVVRVSNNDTLILRHSRMNILNSPLRAHHTPRCSQVLISPWEIRQPMARQYLLAAMLGRDTRKWPASSANSISH